ncbi:MAG: hypothetical protein SP1CHLAM54_11110 [Chlamydiia bacterium]|nr:hypothetical protein [Chlamydiia bacterium]MCH9616014.1 hypothetical protein [Chlamydiia bacterium]MCH9629037.1 hypothetical protein [Chlamydiia bacterium]
MKFKKFALVILCIKCFGLSPYPDKPRDHIAPASCGSDSFMYSVSIPKLQEKYQKAVPKWMNQRISKELRFFKEQGITQEALDTTYNQVKACDHISDEYLRVRAFDYKVYYKGSDKFGIRRLMRTLARLADYPGIPDLPPLDAIFCEADGIPLSDDPHEYWITKDQKKQAPIFAFAAHMDSKYVITMVDRFTMYEWYSLGPQILGASAANPWDSKKKIAFWRGQPSDFDHKMWQAPYEDLCRSYVGKPRFTISRLSYERPDLLNAGFNAIGNCPAELTGFLSWLVKPGISPSEHLEWAYLPAVDGCMCTYPGYLWRLLSNSVTFKQESACSQWFYDALKPYVHYIPLKNDMSDLLEKIVWAQNNELLCKQIAHNSTEFIKENVMPEDHYLHLLEAFRSYSECQRFTSDELRELTEADPTWIRIR